MLAREVESARDAHAVVRDARFGLVVRPVVVLALRRDGVSELARPRPDLAGRRPTTRRTSSFIAGRAPVIISII